MKRIDIINMYRVLGKIKLNKVEDRMLRNSLIGDHLKMFRVARECDEYVAALAGRFDADAVKEANEAYQSYLNETVDIGLDGIGRDTLCDIVDKGDIEMTLGELALLEPYFTEG